ncbi:hypothetical protein BCR43DRAFT_213175 [Syncephalastrum racemosum]|uniref:GATA-type domain-containing protein n=1 Tax=Syncephalastrum racemosum TaxID=13706 RepID=A0A1X2HIQ6_SYNRA|nr:hypothetical protein BCR43DRAFT_213175 [Syncephalastrum racemosum]
MDTATRNTPYILPHPHQQPNYAHEPERRHEQATNLPSHNANMPNKNVAEKASKDQVLPAPLIVSSSAAMPVPVFPMADYPVFYPYHPMACPPTSVSPDQMTGFAPGASWPAMHSTHPTMQNYPSCDIAYAPVIVHPPIHHTLENATITYDTMAERNLQKDLVKDVFFSPAMVTALQDNDDISSASGSSTSRAASVELSCGSPSDSDSEATCSSQVDEVASSPPNVTPSELLFEEDDQIFDLGLDLEYRDQPEEKEESGCLSFARLQRLQDYNNSRDAFSNTMDFSPFKRSHQYHHPHHHNHHHHRQGLSDPSEEKHWYEDMMDEDEDEDMLFGETHSFMDESSDFDDDEQDDYQDDDAGSCYESSRVARPEPHASWWKNAWPHIGQSAKASPSIDEKPSQAHSGQVQSKSAETNTEEQPQRLVEILPARSTQQPTVYQNLTKSQIDWCRYCGTTEGVNWRPGPWGKRTLCK